MDLFSELWILYVYNLMNNHKVSFIFIHGFCFGPSLWTEIIESVKDKASQIVNYSLYKNGQKHSFSINETIEELRSIVQRRPEDHWVIVGHSLGGYIGLEIVQKYPELIKACILFNSHLASDKPRRKKIRTKQIQLIKKSGLYTYLRVFYNSMDEAKATHLNEEYSGPLNEKIVIDQIAYMRDRYPDIHKIKAFSSDNYIGIVHGIEDHLIDQNELFHFFSLLDRGNIVTIPGGHLSPLHYPKTCKNILENMIQDLNFLLSK